jgi:thiol-disulfide isomerase/thioredoxin
VFCVELPSRLIRRAPALVLALSVATPVAASSVPAAPKAAALPAEKPAAQPDPPLLHLGDEAPLFSGALHNPKEAGQEHVDLSSLVGADAEENGARAVLITFFATWCGPCKKELPLLVQLGAEYRAKGLRILSVAIDKDESKWPEIIDLVKKNAVDFPVVKDRYNLIARRYLGEKTALPSVFLVGRDGTIRLVKQGYTADAKSFLRAEVEKLLDAR